MKLRLLALALVPFALAACGRKAPPPAPPAPALKPAPGPTTKKPEPPPPPLTPAQKIAIAADFEAARKIVAEARDLRLKGEQLERESGIQGANDTYVQARKRYRNAAQLTEKWVEAELGEVSEAQVKRDPELAQYAAERGDWIKQDSLMGQKLNAK